MIVAIMQPTYLPWIGYFNLIKKSEYFIFLDDVQFDKRSWQQRNKIIINSNEKYLTVPVHTKNKYLQKLCDVKIDNSKKWIQNHLNSIKFNYGNHEYFKEVFPFLEKTYNQENEYLANLNINLIIEITKYLDLDFNYELSSSFKTTKKKGERILELLNKIKAVKYISPVGSQEYLDKVRDINKEKITIEYIDYICEPYPQRKQSKFFHNLSIIDLIFNHGKQSIKFI